MCSGRRRIAPLPPLPRDPKGGADGVPRARSIIGTRADACDESAAVARGGARAEVRPSGAHAMGAGTPLSVHSDSKQRAAHLQLRTDMRAAACAGPPARRVERLIRRGKRRVASRWDELQFPPPPLRDHQRLGKVLQVRRRRLPRRALWTAAGKSGCAGVAGCQRAARHRSARHGMRRRDRGLPRVHPLGCVRLGQPLSPSRTASPHESVRLVTLFVTTN